MDFLNIRPFPEQHEKNIRRAPQLFRLLHPSTYTLSVCSDMPTGFALRNNPENYTPTDTHRANSVFRKIAPDLGAANGYNDRLQICGCASGPSSAGKRARQFR